jgi:hypothetical protein
MKRAPIALWLAVGACQAVAGSPPRGADASAPVRADTGGDGARRTADMPRLPEDPEAGRRSETQWRAHLEHEEYERQLAFDKRRLSQHRGLVTRLRAARARLDGASSTAAIDRLASSTTKAVTDARKRIYKLDHWGVNSRVLGDYDELLKMLDGAYAAARSAALEGNPAAQDELRARWDQHLKVIDDWLEQAKDDDE